MRFGTLVIFVVAPVAVAVGCAAPSIGQEPAGADIPAPSGTSAPGTASRTQAQQSATTQSAPLPVSDAGAGTDAGPTIKSVPCTEAGAVPSAGHCYFALSTPMSWDAALTACAGANAHLVTITSTIEQTVVEGLLPTDERWIGLRRPTGSPVADGSYAWANGEPRAGFQQWSTAKAEPDGSCPTCTTPGTAECGRILNDNTWADDACSAAHPFICERE